MKTIRVDVISHVLIPHSEYSAATPTFMCANAQRPRSHLPRPTHGSAA